VFSRGDGGGLRLPQALPTSGSLGRGRLLQGCGRAWSPPGGLTSRRGRSGGPRHQGQPGGKVRVARVLTVHGWKSAGAADLHEAACSMRPRCETRTQAPPSKRVVSHGLTPSSSTARRRGAFPPVRLSAAFVLAVAAVAAVNVDAARIRSGAWVRGKELRSPWAAH
jgi:hypothetical protein